MKTLHAVAFEKIDSCGGIDWHPDEAKIKQRYAELLADKDYNDFAISRFAFAVPDGLLPADITDHADAAFWNEDYRPTERRAPITPTNQPRGLLMKITQTQFDALPRVDHRKACPSADYSAVTHFGNSCDFADHCIFTSYSTFGASCTFSNNCSFDEGCTFGFSCSFGDECAFEALCFFSHHTEFGVGCSFADECMFGHWSSFGRGCSFGDECEFGNHCKVGTRGIRNPH